MIKSFNGKTFYYFIALPYKEQARDFAQETRKEGFLVRVVRRKHPFLNDFDFAVYTHPKHPRRLELEERLKKIRQRAIERGVKW